METIHCSGGLKQSETCIHCLVDIETGLLVDPCSEHKTYNKRPKRIDDKSLNLELDLK